MTFKATERERKKEPAFLLFLALDLTKATDNRQEVTNWQRTTVTDLQGHEVESSPQVWSE